MAKKVTKKISTSTKKKTRIGNSKFTKHYNRGGGERGSTPSKKYRKPYRGQGKR